MTMDLSNAQPFTASIPTDGLFRSATDFGSTLYRRVGNKIEQLDTSSLLTPAEIQAAGNRGGQAQVALQKLAAMGINWGALPTTNIADMGNMGVDVGPNKAGYLNNNINDFLKTGVSTGTVQKTFNTPEDIAAAKAQLAAAPQAGNQILASTVPANAAPYATNAGAPIQPLGATSLPAGNLQPGQTGDQVKALQDYLVANGYMTQDQVNTGYGIYGPQTTRAVAALQAKLGVDNSSGPGYWGPLTQAAVAKQATLNSGGAATMPNTMPATPAGGMIPGTQIPSTGNPTVDASLAAISKVIDTNHSAGNIINPNLSITPELAAKFVAQAHQQLDPYYQQQINQVIGDVNANVARVASQFGNQQEQTILDYQNSLATNREAQAGAGTAFSGGRGLTEINTQNTANRALGNLALTTGGQLRDILAGGAAQIGQGATGLTGSAANFQLPSTLTKQVNLEGFRGGATAGGAINTGYNPANYQYGTIGNEYNSGLLGVSNQFLNNYLKAAGNTSPQGFKTDAAGNISLM